MKKCAFSLIQASRLSGEHIWDDWLNRALSTKRFLVRQRWSALDPFREYDALGIKEKLSLKSDATGARELRATLHAPVTMDAQDLQPLTAIGSSYAARRAFLTIYVGVDSATVTAPYTELVLGHPFNRACQLVVNTRGYVYTECFPEKAWKSEPQLRSSQFGPTLLPQSEAAAGLPGS